MRKYSKIIIGIIVVLLAITWLSLPFIITRYVNKKYGKEIIVSSAMLDGFGCVKLFDIQIEKTNVYGIIKIATVCYKDKSVILDGGHLNVTLSTLTSSPNSNITSGYNISGKNLYIHLVKDNISADSSYTSFNKNSVCADQVSVTHPKATAVLWDVCFDRKSKSLSIGNGTIKPTIDIKGYTVGEITFTGITNATKNEAQIDSIKYDENIASNISIKHDGNYGTVLIGTVSLSHKRLYTTPITLNQIAINNIYVPDPLTSKLILSVGEKVWVSIDIAQKKFTGKSSCANWLSVVPAELKNTQISQMKVKGNFDFDVQLNPVTLKINNSCLIDGATPQFIKDLSKPFDYIAYHPDSTQFIRHAGPGTVDWVPLDFVDNMATALTITEDPGFWHHRGIIPKALENSLRDDLKLGRFFRGGSTITMQLAKNLWLSRNKTLGRKLQELILTVALESGLTKEKILELYLNIVEFGPNTYGIGPGCTKILKKYPGAISLSEAIYMAIRLPAPNKPYSYEANLGFINKLIAIGVASGKISEAELAKELQFEQTVYDTDDL